MTKISKHRKKSLLITGMALSMMTSVACSSGQDEAVAIEKGKSIPNQEKASAINKMNLKQQIDFSRQDLATRLGMGIEAIKISGATHVNWRSGALGCPKPGMSYTEALVAGIWINLRVDNTVYRYHAAANGQPFYCPNDRAEPPATAPGAD